jgi:hypothetical protein
VKLLEKQIVWKAIVIGFEKRLEYQFKMKANNSEESKE